MTGVVNGVGDSHQIKGMTHNSLNSLSQGSAAKKLSAPS